MGQKHGVESSPLSTSIQPSGEVKVIAIGDYLSHKSTLLHSFSAQSYVKAQKQFESCDKVVGVSKSQSMKVQLMEVACEEIDELRTMSFTCDTVFLVCFSMKFSTVETIQKIRTEWIPQIQRSCPNPHIIILATQCSSLSLSSVNIFAEVIDLWNFCRDAYEKDIKITNLMQVDVKKDLRAVNELFIYAASLPLNPRKYFTGPEGQKLALMKSMVNEYEVALDKAYQSLNSNKPTITTQITCYDALPGLWLTKLRNVLTYVDQFAEFVQKYNMEPSKPVEERKEQFNNMFLSAKEFVERMENFAIQYREAQRQRDSPRIEAEQMKRISNPHSHSMQFCDVCGYPKKDDNDRLLKVLGKLYHKKCFSCSSCGIKMSEVAFKFYEHEKQPVCITCKKECVASN